MTFECSASVDVARRDLFAALEGAERDHGNCYVRQVNTPLSVLLVGINYAPESTGIAPYTAGLAEGLHERGERVRVLTAYPHYPEWSFREERVPRRRRQNLRGVVVDRFRHLLPQGSGGVGRGLSEISFGLAVSLARWGRTDVVVLVSPALFSTLVTIVRARIFGRRKVVVWVQDLYSLGVKELAGQKRDRLAGLVAAVEGWVLRRADRVVVIHERFRDTIVEQLGVSRDAVAVVRNWSHLDEHVPMDRVQSRRALGWRHDEVIVLHAGNMGVKQGLENVVNAARLAEERCVPVKFVLLGDGNQKDLLVRSAEGIDTISILAPLGDDEFRQALDAADVLLVNELAGVNGMAVPSKLTSYFSTGRPVVAATDPGSVTENEVLVSGGGVVVPAGEPEALLAAVESLAADAERSAELGRAGQAFRAARLTETGAIDSYAQVLEGLARRHTAPGTTGTKTE